MSAKKERVGWRTWLRRLALVLASTAAALAASEAVLRSVLFGDGWLAQQYGEGLREAKFYADDSSDDDFWKLNFLFAGPKSRGEVPTVFDPLLGWGKTNLDPETYAPRVVAKRPGIRPVLLYGDSFAACVTGRSECYQGILDASDLRDTHVLYNYGVGGYGLGQVYLLLRASLRHFAGTNAVVAVSILPDDLDRASLAIRSWPKPRFGLVDGRLVEPAPVAPGTSEYIEAHPVGITSYLWRYVLYGSGILPHAAVSSLTGKEERTRAKTALARALIEAIQDELEAAGLDYFFLVFDQEATLKRRRPSWHWPFLERTFADLGIPFVHTKTDLFADMRATGRRLHEYYIPRGRGGGHYNPLGNEVTFRTIRRGMEGRFDTALTLEPPPVPAGD